MGNNYYYLGQLNLINSAREPKHYRLLKVNFSSRSSGHQLISLKNSYYVYTKYCRCCDVTCYRFYKSVCAISQNSLEFHNKKSKEVVKPKSKRKTKNFYYILHCFILHCLILLISNYYLSINYDYS